MRNTSPAAPSEPSEQPAGILDSWKEIANYVKRDVSTVQRWEKREGMPIHRHLHDKRGSVYAVPSELDSWLQSRKSRLEEEEQSETAPVSSPVSNKDEHPAVREAGRWLILGAVAVVVLLAAAYLIRHRRSPNADNPRISSVAVLPLKNLSGDPAQEYLADGITEELIGRLANIHGLRVISRTSVMHFKDTQLSVPEIARVLGIDAVVEGSVIREADQIRVHAQLIRGATDEHIWAGQYQREFRSVLAVEDEVARNIAEQVQTSLTAAETRPASERLVDPEAYEDYLKGRYYLNQRTTDAMNKSVAYFEQAIAKDPSYALAYSGLADSYALLGFRGGLPSNEALSKATAAALKATKLDDTLADPHVSLAFIAETHEWDWTAAQREYKRALQLNPDDARAHNWYAGYLIYVGRFDEGIEEAKRARDLDPLSLPVNNALAGRLLVAGRYDEAFAQVQKTLELDPHFAPAHQTLGWAYLNQGKQSEALREFQQAVQLSGSDDTDLLLDLGFAYAKVGRRKQALEILSTLKKEHGQGLVPSGSVAILYGALGELNAAFAWLDKAYQERDPELTYLKVPGRRFEPLRHDPRFQEFVHRIGFPE